jgi:hypothetical protein
MAETREELRLRVMADYLSSGIWLMKPVGPFRHSMINHKKLRLPAELAKQFNDWIEWYNDNLPDPDRPAFDLPAAVAQEYNDWLDWFLGEPVIFDVEKFNAEGLRLATALKAFMGADVYVEFQPERINGISQAQEIRLGE